ncbi:hypothetical protein CDAR_505131 [Caerostris darwini]|uniref:Uncharacterized protein n=1 Tax=Caerostris darwini TaxID=1538125 RepID=A0AAV4QJA5_9ARAC|nr:hypothetical protein CDAR_505131 [Caerostris darwini]
MPPAKIPAIALTWGPEVKRKTQANMEANGRRWGEPGGVDEIVRAREVRAAGPYTFGAFFPFSSFSKGEHRSEGRLRHPPSGIPLIAFEEAR